MIHYAIFLARRVNIWATSRRQAVHGACLSKIDTWRTDSRITEEELRQLTC